MMNFSDLMETSPDANHPRQMNGCAAKRMPELEVGTVTGIAHGWKDPNRRPQRDSYRGRDWDHQRHLHHGAGHDLEGVIWEMGRPPSRA